MKKQVLSQRELKTEEILKAALPECTIRANMRMVDVIQAKNQYMLGYHLDFVICDSSNYAIAAVELDDRTHDTIDGRRRDKNKNKWLADANIKLILIREPEDAHQIRGLIQNYTPPKNKSNTSRFVFMVASLILTVWLLPKIIIGIGNKMTQDLIKQANENAAQAIKKSNALKAQQMASQVAITGQPTLGTTMVFVKGKTLKECAPNNYINETALRCTKDHYEPRTAVPVQASGNH